ncbi:PAS domain-containing serine/threonine-protein kinase-like [Watersipora subatra]|uniref:PAS domain-containing serine/threonine-protein kinase-like n=1 Tax=Watersipora subatra TaxID=2589382 RepID=UPI00355BCB45
MDTARLVQSLPQETFRHLKMAGGSACPSPLDRIRTGKRERAAQLGLATYNCEYSFEANQSFPKSTLTKLREEVSSPTKQDTLAAIGKGVHDVSFSRPASRGSFGVSPLPPTDVASHLNASHEQSLNQSWIFYKYTATSGASSPESQSLTESAPPTDPFPINPNKSVVTINPRTTEILMANDMACELFGKADVELIGERLTELLNLKHKGQGSLGELDLDPETGEIVQISGRIMEASHTDGVSLSVSVWTSLLKTDSGNRCIVVMEPVQKIASTATVSHNRLVLTCDNSFVNLFGYSSSGELIDADIDTVLPFIKLPSEGGALLEEHRKQTTTGLSKSGSSFPVSLRINSTTSKETASKPTYTVTVWVFTSISGLVTVSSTGAITAINDNFAKFLCGYQPSELIGKPINCLLPDLEGSDILHGEFLDSGSIPLPPFEDEVAEPRSECSNKSKDLEQDHPSLSRCDTDVLLAEATAAFSHVALHSDHDDAFERSNTTDLISASSQTYENRDSSYVAVDEGCEACRLHRQTVSGVEPGELLDCSHSPTKIAADASPLLGNVSESSSKHLTSTPSRVHHVKAKESSSSSYQLQEGCYGGRVQHKDGTFLGVVIHAKKVESMNGEVSNCLWISQDPEQLGEAAQHLVNLTLASSFSQSINASLPQTPISQLPNKSEHLEDTVEFPPSDGLYREKYKTTLSVGKGAFGFVKLAQRRSDQQEFVVKFIRKSKVLKDCWIEDKDLGYVSLEISLLSQLDHCNIVKLVDVFENKEYFQLVMEKHGTGIDLFEFIERNPNMDERLASYIFRQIVEAISYLHSLSIIHRDIKDENIILNENFDIKLIDFGSASFLQKGKMFSTFCGTVEYCSPEVLLGNKYRGPELEVWSMGVTLYTLVFGENPFYDVEETIAAVLKPPFIVSSALLQLVHWMLHPDSLFRARIRDILKHKWVTQPVNIHKYSWEEVLPNFEFNGNVAADNRPNPLLSSDDENKGSSPRGNSSSDNDDDDVRLEMIKYLNDDV